LSQVRNLFITFWTFHLAARSSYCLRHVRPSVRI